MDKTERIEDFQQLKEELVEYLTRISKAVENIMVTIEENDISILNDVEKASKELSEAESIVSTYFLNSLLSEYTRKKRSRRSSYRRRDAYPRSNFKSVVRVDFQSRKSAP